MKKLVCYQTGSIWDVAMLSAGLVSLPADPIRLRLLSGRVELVQHRMDTHDSWRHLLCKNRRLLWLQADHSYTLLSSSNDMRCLLEFYCSVEDYTHKKYGLTKTHSEVINAVRFIAQGEVLDLGCGRGRNALYLHKLGHRVTALDQCRLSIDQLKNRVIAENLTHFNADYYDINQATLIGHYDFIVSTVVMMFLDPSRIAAVIRNMQSVTKIDGFNLIVSPMSTLDCPCAIPFPFTFKEGELKRYYQQWHIHKYNENKGQLHKTDRFGRRITLRFATLLAQKSVF